MDTTKRGVRRWKEVQRQGEDKVSLRISLLVPIVHKNAWLAPLQGNKGPIHSTTFQSFGMEIH